MDRPSHLSEDQQQQPAAAATAGAPRSRRGSDCGSTGKGAPEFSGLPLGGGGVAGQMLRARLFGAPGAKKKQVDRKAAAAGCSAVLQSMQPTVEQASMFLFRCGDCADCTYGAVCVVLGTLRSCFAQQCQP